MSMMFFYFLKIIFDISTSKQSKRYKPLNFSKKKKILKFDETQLQTQCQRSHRSASKENMSSFSASSRE